MSYIAYGISRTRITLYATNGVTPLCRVTFQKETKEGLELSFQAEGALHGLGSGGAWGRRWVHRGFRPKLNVLWTHGLESAVERWEGWGWGDPETRLTAEALGIVFAYAFVAPCLVEPHLDNDYSFTAQPDPDKPLNLKDVKGVAHTGLELVLIGTYAEAELPGWAYVARLE